MHCSLDLMHSTEKYTKKIIDSYPWGFIITDNNPWRYTRMYSPIQSYITLEGFYYRADCKISNHTTNTSRGQNYCCLLLQHGKVVIKLLSTIPCLYSLPYQILFKLNKAPTKWCLHNWQHPCSQVRNLKQKHKPQPKYKESLRPNPCYDQRTYFHNNRDVGDFVTLSSGAEVNCHEAIKMLMINMITFTL